MPFSVLSLLLTIAFCAPSEIITVEVLANRPKPWAEVGSRVLMTGLAETTIRWENHH